MTDKIIIAIDGFASTGKSTLAKRLAEYLNYIYVDSGSMYRAITYFALTHNYLPFNDANLKEFSEELHSVKLSFVFNKNLGYSEIFLNDVNVEKEIRSINVSNHVSSVATVSFIRKHMVSLQKKISLNKGVVMDGRDIGSVVFPNAEFKFYLDAKAEITEDTLVASGLVRRKRDGVRILAKGELKSKIKLNVTGASKAAIDAVAKAGGSLTIASSAE